MKSIAPTFVSGASFNISRRRFLQSASAFTALAALPTLGADALEIINGKPRRVGLIGAGWYGKSDLWRLAQVTPVEIISICDPDKHMLAEAVEIASQRQKSKKKKSSQKQVKVNSDDQKKQQAVAAKQAATKKK